MILLVVAFSFIVAAATPTARVHPVENLISIPLVKLHIPLLGIQLDALALHQRRVAHSQRRLAAMSSQSLKPNLLLGDVFPEHAPHPLPPSEDATQRRRESDAEVTKSNTAYYPHSAGLDIEGQDIGYMATLGLGTPPRAFKLLVDSGSADLWVGSEQCQADTGGNCGDHQFLGSRSSSSFQPINKTWFIRYGTGAANGQLAKDHVVFPGGLRLDNHTFGVAHNESSEFTKNNIPLDGVLGCAKQNLSMQSTMTFLDALRARNLISEPIISYKLSRIADGTNDGEITLGGMDPTTYNPLTLVEIPNVNKGGFWEAKVDGIQVNGRDLGLHGRSCIFDTGTTLFLASKADVEQIHQGIPGAIYNKASSNWRIPCNTTTIISLVFGGKEFSVEPEDLATSDATNGMCMSAIAGGGVDGAWLVGAVFLKNVILSTNERTDKIALARRR
ncbi:Peptidase A1 domain-containing protein [Mycena chlorophos]|uniref:Peptidase A1 domain-containing protein n=1 Tax=Mycena chlorophos TaxID=658473 RepID=A0A8H6TG31_MYCCL|nr:Peptidase A1 domain-containing protein [Mycena chlorophos]